MGQRRTFANRPAGFRTRQSAPAGTKGGQKLARARSRYSVAYPAAGLAARGGRIGGKSSDLDAGRIHEAAARGFCFGYPLRDSMEPLRQSLARSFGTASYGSGETAARGAT